jgi:hypothetical protein
VTLRAGIRGVNRPAISVPRTSGAYAIKAIGGETDGSESLVLDVLAPLFACSPAFLANRMR